MTYTFYFLIVFVIWIIMEICRKSKAARTNDLRIQKANEPDIRDIDKGIDYWLGLGYVMIPLILIFCFVPEMRLVTAVLTSILIIYLVYKSNGFKYFKVGMGVFFLIVLWSIYLNLIPY